MARTQSVKLNKSKIDQNPQEVPHKEYTETKESLWAARGMDDVFFQREAQVTWWSVMVGIAVGALLTRLEALLLEFQNGHWYFALYFLAICCIIINSWVQTAWGSLVLRCPISIPFASSLFFQGLFMSVASLQYYQSLFVVCSHYICGGIRFVQPNSFLKNPLVDHIT